MCKTRLILIFLFLAILKNLLIIGPSAAQSVMPVQVPLSRTESDHFIYIYEEPLQDQIPAIIRNCEDAHAILSPVLKWAPKNKTVVMYSDAQDVHNGWATVYPRPIMMIYASDAPPGSTIYEPGDYIRRTIFHEYAHLLAMDAQYGVDAFMTDIFGRIYPIGGDLLSFALMLLSAPPGVMAPAWYNEGLSIWAETEFAGPGRGRSTRVDMIMRMAVADKRVLKANEWFLELPEWPYGAAAYLYGMKTIEYIHDRYGFQDQEKNAPGEIADSVAHSFMSVFNKQSKPLTGKSFQQLAYEAREAEISRQTGRLQKLKTVALTNLERLTPKRLIVIKPLFGPEGRSIYFSGREEAGRHTLFRYDMSTKRLVKPTSARTTIPLFTDLASSPDRKTIYYTRLDIHGRDRLRSEVYRLDKRKDRSRLLTKKGRYRYPAISPGGAHLAAVVNRKGKQSLITVPIDKAGEKQFEKTIVKASQNHSLIDPAFSPDGRYIIYVLADEKASQLRRVDVSSGQDEGLLKWPGIILSPACHPFDRSLVFVSDRNGVYNLYRIPFVTNAEPVALTNMLGGIFSPDFSPDGKRLTATAYDSYGYYLTVLDYEKIRPAGSLAFIDDNWKSLPSNLAAIEAVKTEPVPQSMTARKYNSFTNIEFDFWSPWLTTSRDGVMGGLSAAFSDPTKFQNLQLLAGAESEYEIPIGSLVYKYSGFYPIFTLYSATGPEYYDDLVRDNNNIYYDYDEEVRVGCVAMTLPWMRVDWKGNLTLGYQISDRSVIKDSAEEYISKTLTTTNLFEGTERALWARLDFFNATAFGRSHSLEDGRYLAATLEWSDESLGSDINRTRVRGDWHEYINMPWLENQTLKLQGAYATGTGDESAQGLFGLGGYLPAIIAPQGLDRNISLRGYPANYQVGDEIVKGAVAYRFPIYQRYKNVTATMPLYLHQIFSEVYYEGGKVTGEGVVGQENEWINAAGLEINLSTTLFRFLPIAPGIGIVYAFDYEERKQAGEDSDEDNKLQIYVSLKTTINF